MARLLANVVVKHNGKSERLEVGDELPVWAVGKVPPALLSGGVVSATQEPPQDAFGGSYEDDDPDVGDFGDD